MAAGDGADRRDLSADHALGRAMLRGDTKRSVYEERGILVF
jgi:hypothetical protein